MAHLSAVFTFIRLVVPKILKEKFSSIFVKDLLLFAAHHEIPLFLMNSRVLRIILSHAHDVA